MGEMNYKDPDWLAGFDGVEFVPVPGRGTHLLFVRDPG
jgi:hypothetical protein